MGASKKLFNDIRQTEEYENFDHHKNFCKRVKENWLSNQEFGQLKNASLMELTQALIDKKMDNEYQVELMKLIDKKEPKYLKDSEYLFKVKQTPLENMKRVYKKYDNTYFFVKSQRWIFDLQTEIMKKERELKDK